MSAARRPRGATAIRDDQMQLPQIQLPQLSLPPKHVLVAAAIIAFVAIAFISATPDKDDTSTRGELEVPPHTAQSQPNPDATPGPMTDSSSQELFTAAQPPTTALGRTNSKKRRQPFAYLQAGRVQRRGLAQVISQASDGQSRWGASFRGKPSPSRRMSQETWRRSAMLNHAGNGDLPARQFRF